MSLERMVGLGPSRSQVAKTSRSSSLDRGGGRVSLPPI